MQDKVNYITLDTFQRILDYVPELHIRKWYDSDISMLFQIQYWCALRPIEAIIRKKEDFNLIDRELYLGKTKTTKLDNAVIPLEFIPTITSYLQNKENGRLFPNLTYNTFYVWIIRMGIALNIPAWTIPESESGEKTKGHIFRKSIGKDMYLGKLGEKSKNIFIISKHLRHKDVATTMNHYLKLDSEAVKEVL